MPSGIQISIYKFTQMLLFFFFVYLKIMSQNEGRKGRFVNFSGPLPTLRSNNVSESGTFVLPCRIITTKVSHNHKDFSGNYFQIKANISTGKGLDFKLNSFVYTLEFMIKRMICLFNN